MKIKGLPHSEVHTESPWERPRAEAFRKKNGYRLQTFNHVSETARSWIGATVNFGLAAIFGMTAANFIPNDTVSLIVKCPFIALATAAVFSAVGANDNISLLKRGEYLYGLPRRPKP